VSALANGVGGLFVIGIETAHPQGDDFARSWRCTNAALSSERIVTLLGNCVEPPFDSAFLNGIEVERFQCPDDPSLFGCGILVPQSEQPPHQVAVGSDAGKYLVATAKGLAHVRHEDLARLMRGKPATIRFEEVRVEKGPRSLSAGKEREVEFRVELVVRNCGPGPVRDVLLRAVTPLDTTSGRPGPSPFVASTAVGQYGRWTATADTGEPYQERHTESQPVIQEQITSVFGHLVRVAAQAPHTVLSYSGAYQVFHDRGHSPALVVGFTTTYGEDGLWCEPAVEYRETAEVGPDPSSSVFFRYSSGE
jgi:hypothetical protein